MPSFQSIIKNGEENQVKKHIFTILNKTQSLEKYPSFYVMSENKSGPLVDSDDQDLSGTLQIVEKSKVYDDGEKVIANITFTSPPLGLHMFLEFEKENNNSVYIINERIRNILFSAGYKFVQGLIPSKHKPILPEDGAARDDWFQYKYDCDKWGSIKFTHKMLSEKLGINYGWTRHAYANWKRSHLNYITSHYLT